MRLDVAPQVMLFIRVSRGVAAIAPPNKFVTLCYREGGFAGEPGKGSDAWLDYWFE
jgi:hypothetical protein